MVCYGSVYSIFNLANQFHGGYFRFAVGGWWLVVGGWWLVVGGWWLVVCGSWLEGLKF